jgi:hypothetical protein
VEGCPGALKLVEVTILAFFAFAIVVLLIWAVLGYRGRLALYHWAHRGRRTAPRH